MPLMITPGGYFLIKVKLLLIMIFNVLVDKITIIRSLLFDFVFKFFSQFNRMF